MLCFRIVNSVHITVHCYSYTLLSSHCVLLLKLTSQFNCSALYIPVVLIMSWVITWEGKGFVRTLGWLFFILKVYHQTTTLKCIITFSTQQTYRINKVAAEIAKKACQEVQQATGTKEYGSMKQICFVSKGHSGMQHLWDSLLIFCTRSACLHACVTYSAYERYLKACTRNVHLMITRLPVYWVAVSLFLASFLEKAGIGSTSLRDYKFINLAEDCQMQSFHLNAGSSVGSVRSVHNK